MLKITNIQKNYDNFNLNCTLQVSNGVITGLIGANGAGKSTTFKAILGLIAINSGEIELFGKDITQLTNHDKERIGVVLADSGFSGYLTIKDIIPILRSLYSKFDYDYFMTLIRRFDLPLTKKIKDFSTGMKAKLKVIVAISHEAEFLILDEPTAGLDVLARDELLDLLRDYLTENQERSILISSHISSDLENLCDDLYMIDDGQIIYHEDTDVILSQYALLKVSSEQFNKLDKQYLLKYKQETFGYSCLTNQKQFYHENYPNIVLENGTIDDVFTMMIKGE